MPVDIETGVGIFWALRQIPPSVGAPLAAALEESGVVDEVVIWDQLTSWWPQALWGTDVTPQAELFEDIDTLQDPFITIAFALAATEKMGFAVSTDAIRRDPPELLQTMLTLAAATEGKARLLLGAGEVRAIAPFGRKRSEGLARLEDALRIFRLLLETDRPTDFEGKIWKYKNAWIGNARHERRPQILAMGGGPKLIEMAPKYADGWISGVPFVYSRPAEYGDEVLQVKKALAEHGRDESSFLFGLYHVSYLCDSNQQFLDNLDHPLLKWYAATGGRLNQRHWAKEGLTPALPEDWHYALHMRSAEMTRDEIDAILEKTTPEMVEKAYLHGTPEEVAAQILEYVPAGCNYHLMADLAPIIGVDPQQAIKRNIEVCRILKSEASKMQ